MGAGVGDGGWGGGWGGGGGGWGWGGVGVEWGRVSPHLDRLNLAAQMDEPRFSAPRFAHLSRTHEVHLDGTNLGRLGEVGREHRAVHLYLCG